MQFILNQKSVWPQTKSIIKLKFCSFLLCYNLGFGRRTKFWNPGILNGLSPNKCGLLVSFLKSINILCSVAIETGHIFQWFVKKSTLYLATNGTFLMKVSYQANKDFFLLLPSQFRWYQITTWNKFSSFINKWLSPRRGARPIWNNWYVPTHSFGHPLN